MRLPFPPVQHDYIVGRVSLIRGIKTKPTRRILRPSCPAQRTTRPSALPPPFVWASIYKDWFKTKKPLGIWSTNWAKWGGILLFASPDHWDEEFQHEWNTRIEGILGEEYGIIDGPARPIFFLPHDAGHWFMFTVGGKYYFYNDGEYLERYRWEYRGDADFVARFKEEEDMSDDLGKIKPRWK